MTSSIVITHNPADFMFSAGIRSYTTMTFLPKVLRRITIIQSKAVNESSDLAGV